jgi:hypothetical protein
MRPHHETFPTACQYFFREDSVENFDRRVNGPFNFRREQFERLGLHRTMNEPMRVYCDVCGAEIDPWKAFADAPHAWWRCPRGCNQKTH